MQSPPTRVYSSCKRIKTTLETSGEDYKNTLETSGEDYKNTLETSGEDYKNTLETSREDAENLCEMHQRKFVENHQTTLQTSGELPPPPLSTQRYVLSKKSLCRRWTVYGHRNLRDEPSYVGDRAFVG
jgi:hypothetical protein